MVGTPWLSRVTLTRAESPRTAIAPSSWGRAERAMKYNHVGTASAPKSTNTKIRTKSRRNQRLRRGTATATVVVAMGNFDFRGSHSRKQLPRDTQDLPPGDKMICDHEGQQGAPRLV